MGEAFGSRYHIIKLLGMGGMGAVYQAWDQELGVAVALKVIRPGAVWPSRESKTGGVFYSKYTTFRDGRAIGGN
jgi:serine/threonine protein kinase